MPPAMLWSLVIAALHTSNCQPSSARRLAICARDVDIGPRNLPRHAHRPFLCCCACTGCLDVEDVMDDSKLLIFMTSGLWPYALAIVVLALAAAVASVPLVLPFVLYNGCKTRPALDQNDGHMRASV